MLLPFQQNEAPEITEGFGKAQKITEDINWVSSWGALKWDGNKTTPGMGKQKKSGQEWCGDNGVCMYFRTS